MLSIHYTGELKGNQFVSTTKHSRKCGRKLRHKCTPVCFQLCSFTTTCTENRNKSSEPLNIGLILRGLTTNFCGTECTMDRLLLRSSLSYLCLTGVFFAPFYPTLYYILTQDILLYL